MTTIYLIRHAEAEGNLYRIAQGQDNSNLTDRGWRQVRALEQRFAEIHIDAVYSSDLYRTCATASAVYKPKGLLLQRVAELREVCVGIWEQRTWGDIYRNWPEQMHHFSHDPAKWHVEGAETLQALQERVLHAVEKIAAENEGKTIALFSHGYAIRVLLAKLQGYPIDRVAESPTGDNTAVSCLETDGKKLRVVFRDDNSHLKTPEFLAGEKVSKRTIALEPGLYFEPLQLPEQAELFVRLEETAWQDAAEKEPFDAERLLKDAADRCTLVGYRDGEAVGLVQFGTKHGRISLLCVEPDYRKRGFGVQMIGQAVQYWRPRGEEKLQVLLSSNDAAVFFRDYGFFQAGTAEDGRTVMEKNIRFEPEFL